MYVAGYFQAFLLSYNNAIHIPIDSPQGKPFCLLLPELHRYELHCPVNYHKCFISLQRINNLLPSLILVLCSQDMPFTFKKILSLCFIQMVFRLNITQLHCVLSKSTSYYFKNTLQILAILTLHFVTVKVSIISIARCKDPTVIGPFPIVLFALITVCSLQIQLALLKPPPSFFTPILFLLPRLPVHL